MGGDNPRLLALAADIVNDIPVDWTSALQDPAYDAVRGVVQQLSDVARIGALHRTCTSALATSHLGQADTGATVVGVDTPPPGFASGTWHQLTILERLGGGSFGEVFRAFDPQLDREVALKLLLPHVTISPEQALHEGRLLARVRHPNVVTVYGAAIDKGVVGFWMELVHGRTLAERLRTQGAVSGREVLRIAGALADAVSAVHGAGLLHRDIKAENVMETQDGRIVLMDLGAGQTRSDASTLELAGSPLYIAPEVLQGGAASIHSDIYSIGVLLHLLATGRYPVEARSLEQLRAAHARGAGEKALQLHLTRVPRELRRTIAQALAPRPDRRFATAAAMSRGVRRPPRLTAVSWTASLSLMFAIIAAIWVLQERRSVTPSTSVASTRTERLPFLQVDGTFFLPRASRDGAQVVFSHGPNELTIVRLDSGRTRRIAVPRPGSGEEQYVYDAVISRDGRHVAYTSYARTQQRAWLREADIDTGVSRTLIDGETISFIQSLDWSPDDKQLLIQVGQIHRQPRLAIVDMASAALRDVSVLKGSVTAASFSPDGRYVVMDETDVDDMTQLPVVDLATGARSPLIPSSGHNTNPAWLNDRIVFVGNRDQRSRLWSLPMRGAKPVAPPVLVADDLGPIMPWGFDGAGALIYQPRTGPSRVVQAGFDQLTGRLTTEPQPVADGALETWASAWSPDGGSLAYFQATGVSRPEATLHIRTIASGEEQVRNIPGGRGFILRWSSDGSRLAWVSRQNGSRAISVLDAPTGTIRSWARWLSVPPNGTTLSMAWVPGNPTLVVAEDNRVYRIGPEPKHPQTTIFRVPSGSVLVQGLAFSNDRQSVIFAVQADAARVDLLAVPWAGGASRALWRTDSDHFRELFARSPNGRFLVVTAAQQRDVEALDPSVLTVWNPTDRTQHVLSMGSRFSDVSVSPSGDRIAWTSGIFIAMSQPVRVVPLSPATPDLRKH